MKKKVLHVPRFNFDGPPKSDFQIAKSWNLLNSKLWIQNSILKQALHQKSTQNSHHHYSETPWDKGLNWLLDHLKMKIHILKHWTNSGMLTLKSRWVGLTVIIMQASVQIGLNWYWTGTELGNIIFSYLDDSKLRPSVSNCLGTQNLIFFVPVWRVLCFNVNPWHLVQKTREYTFE